MKLKKTDKIRQIIPMAILVLLVVVIIYAQTKMQNISPVSIINYPDSVTTDENTINLASDFNNAPAQDILAKESLNSILNCEKIKSKNPAIESNNPFHDSRKKISQLDVFNLFGRPAKAAQNNDLFVETLALENSITTQVNRVLDGKVAGNDYFTMTLNLADPSNIATFSHGDYVLYESDQSITAQYQLSEKKLKESIIIYRPLPGVNLLFDLDYPADNQIIPTGNGGFFVVKNIQDRAQAVWQIPPATITDRKGNSSVVTMEIVNAKQIRYSFDQNFIDAADFPIVFDPSIEIPDSRFLHQMVWDDEHNQAVLFGGVQLLPTYGYPSNTYGVADTWIYRVGDVPEYNASHIYDFTICLSNPTTLSFAVNDPISYDNTGSYTVKTCTNSSCGTPQTLTVNFSSGTTPTTTTSSYSGCFNIEVSGYGEAAGTQFSDAFYRFTDASHNNIADPVHYTLGNGDNNFALIINGNSPTYLIPGHEGRWMKKYPATSPGARGMFSMTWDSQNNQVILYGGANYADSTFYSDTWVYLPPASENEPGEWVRKNPSGNPGKLARTQMAFDKQNNKVIMHSGLLWSGYGLYGNSTGLTWTYDPDANSGQGTWTQVSATGPDVYLHTMDWDEQNNQVILFGGDKC